MNAIRNDSFHRARRVFRADKLAPSLRRSSRRIADLGNSRIVRSYYEKVAEIPLLQHEEIMELAKRGTPQDINEIVRHNLRLAIKVANEYLGCGLSFMDMVQEGNLGLIHAARKFDPQRGTKFSNYAVWWIRAYIIKGIINNTQRVKISQNVLSLIFRVQKAIKAIEQEVGEPLSAEDRAEILSEINQADQKNRRITADQIETIRLGMNTEPLEELIATNQAPDDRIIPGEEALDLSKRKEQLDSILRAVLNDHEINILSRRIYNNETLKAIGMDYGVSRERIRQIESRALNKLLNSSFREQLEELKA